MQVGRAAGIDEALLMDQPASSSTLSTGRAVIHLLRGNMGPGMLSLPQQFALTGLSTSLAALAVSGHLPKAYGCPWKPPVCANTPLIGVVVHVRVPRSLQRSASTAWLCSFACGGT